MEQYKGCFGLFSSYLSNNVTRNQIGLCMQNYMYMYIIQLILLNMEHDLFHKLVTNRNVKANKFVMAS